jgi:geranylgeranyl diphosphate synthase, type I
MPKKTGASGPPSRRNGRSKRLAPKSVRTNPFGVLLPTVRRDIDARLSGFFDAQIDAARAFGEPVVHLTESVRDLCLRGGKRLRAALVVAGYQAASPVADIEPALDAGLALELLHGYFLVHDDWMDQDSMRRGGPSVHTALAGRYASEHLGAAAAVLGGDLLVALATDLISRVDVPPRRLPHVFTTFSEMQIHAVAGQQLDLIKGDRDPERTYELKTGSYTVRGPLVLGAHLAGAPTRLVSALDRFAMPIGVAFQHRDDLLGAFADPEQTGKPRGSDLKAGKHTALYAHGVQLSGKADRGKLARVFGNARASERQLAEALSILDASGARATVEARISELVERGFAALRTPAVPEDARRLLEGAAEALVFRQS